MHDFGDYECLNEVASGSTGTVWRARHRELDRVVAVKELSPALRDRPGFLDLFRSEARNLATIDDPHVIRLYDYVEEADRTWMAEEWVDGVRLDLLLQAHGRLTTEQALGVLRGVLHGLAAAHAVRLVHGDVAPSNILVSADGTAKLVDFGLAAPAGSDADPELLGTPAYLSPEAVRRSRRDPRSDVYSAAAVLVELLTGSPPFVGVGVADVLRQQVEAPVPALTELGPPLRDLVRRALAKNPDERPADAVSFLTALETAAREERGAGWLDRSSVAGVAAGLLAGGVGGAAGGMLAGAVMGATGVGGAGATSTAAASVVTSTVTTGTVGTAASGGATSSSTLAAKAGSTAARSGSRKLLYLTGGGTTAAAAAVAATILLTSRPAQLVAVSGQYHVTQRVVTSEFTNTHAGDVVPQDAWRLPACRGHKTCTGQISIGGGAQIPFTFDGTVLSSRYSQSTTESCGSFGLSHERVDGTITLRLEPARGASGTDRSFTGTQAVTITALSVPPHSQCRIGAPKHETDALTLTRIGS